MYGLFRIRWILLLASTPIFCKNIQEIRVSRSTIQSTIEFLASDQLNGRKSLSPGNKKARAWLIERMSHMGLKPAGNSPDSYEFAFHSGVNLIGILYPEGTAEAEPAILLSAHFDHIGAHCSRLPGASSEVCNGAADNAAGVAAALAVVEALRGRVERPVAIALWDHEENGMKGSQSFVFEPSIPLTSLKLLINLDVVGLNFLPGMERTHFVMGAETGGKELFHHLQAALATVDLDPLYLTYAFGHNRGDVTRFLEAGVHLPFVFFSDGDVEAYHTSADEMGTLNMEKVVEVADAAARLTLLAIREHTPYRYQPPDMSIGQVLPVYEDSASLRALYQDMLGVVEKEAAGSGEVEKIKGYLERLQNIVAAGAPSFSMAEAAFLGQAALEASAYSRTQAAQP